MRSVVNLANPAGIRAIVEQQFAEAARIAACGVALHGMAGAIAAAGGRPVTAMDIIEALPHAVADARRGRS